MPLVKLTQNFSDSYEAIFDPEKGMNLISFKKNEVELLDQSTASMFKERCAGLGALIGPHFYHRPDSIIPPVPEDLFPHFRNIDFSKQKEPFSHGIARYVPWDYEASTTQVDATLSGDSLYSGVALKDLQGFNFKMHLHAALVHDGLLIEYTISSEKPSVIGFHYYYRCEPGSIITSKVSPNYRFKEKLHPIDKAWMNDTQEMLHFQLNQETDFNFHPLHREEDGSSFVIKLKQPSYMLHIEFNASHETDSSWQLYHPKDSSFVCIEPLSALDPRHPNLTFSKLQMKINAISN